MTQELGPQTIEIALYKRRTAGSMIGISWGELLAVAALSMSADALSRNLRRILQIDTLPTRLSYDTDPSTALAR